MKRRLIPVLLFVCGAISAQTAADSVIFSNLFAKAQKENWASLPVGKQMTVLAGQFLNAPYVASTLEAPGQERLRVNLREFDCTTLVENVLALHRMLAEGKNGWEEFRNELTNIRYRDGRLADYTSRLHYASDWITDNTAKGIVRIPTGASCAQTFKPAVSFMSQHPGAYAALKRDTSLISRIAAREHVINQWSFPYLPKQALSDKIPFIQEGDLIFITTNLSGLDFSHVGLAVRRKGKVFLLHASSTAGKVVVTEESLAMYLSGIKKHTGVVVVRPE